jgi:hypothetical protein
MLAPTDEFMDTNVFSTIIENNLSTAANVVDSSRKHAFKINKYSTTVDLCPACLYRDSKYATCICYYRGIVKLGPVNEKRGAL